MISDNEKAATKGKKCMNGHILLETKQISFERAKKLAQKFDGISKCRIYCDLCQETIFFLKNKEAKKEFYTCDSCEFDICHKCYQSFR